MATSPAPAPAGRNLLADGTSSVLRLGLRRHPLGDLYHSLVTASWAALIGLALVALLCANALWAAAYVAFGVEIENARPGSFADAFFFSVQTMATIGYGRLIPRSSGANVLATIEALSGVLGFAVVTGLVFSKFARPTARVLFSRVAAVGPRDGVRCLTFRMANERGNQIVEAQVRVVLLRNEVTQEGETMRRLHDLELVRSQSPAFALTWTAIHPIDERSPLFGRSPAELAASNPEVLVTLVGLDESFSQTVHARHAYALADVRWDHRFVDLFERRPDGRRRIDYRRFHDVAPLPAAPSARPSSS